MIDYDKAAKIIDRSVVDNTTGCWNYTGCKSKSGYSRVNYNGRCINGQRALWQFLYGELPKYTHVLHHCDNRLCVNPAHLFVGTNQDNVSDKIKKGRGVNPIATLNKNKSHCKNGHEYTEDNTWYESNGSRHCKTCNKERQKVRRLRKSLTKYEHLVP